MHKCYVISFPDVFQFLICRSTCFVAYFHILTSQKLRGNGIGILFLTLVTCENNDKLKLSFTNKTIFCPLLVTFDVLRLYVVTEKSKFLCAIFRVLIHSDPKILQISFLQPFSVKTWSVNVIKLSSSYKTFRRVVLQRHSLIPKSIFTGEYQYQYTCCFILIFHI